MENKCDEQICVLAGVTGADKVKFWLSRKDRKKLSALRKVNGNVLPEGSEADAEVWMTASILTYCLQD